MESRSGIKLSHSNTLTWGRTPTSLANRQNQRNGKQRDFHLVTPPDSKHLCAYLGLVPSLHQSGDTTVTGHITKEGNKWLRRNLTECSRVAVRKDPHLRRFYLKLTHKRGEKKAILAIARKLVAYAYWMLKRNQTYEELSPWDGS